MTKIKENKLFKIQDQLEYLFKLNKIEYLIDYNEKSKDTNAHLFISVDIKDRFRFASCSFGGGDKLRFLIYKQEREDYYLKEGFEPDFIKIQKDIWSREIYDMKEFLGELCWELDYPLIFEENS